MIHNNNYYFLYFSSLCDKKYDIDLLKQILNIEIKTNINIGKILINHDYVQCTRLINQFVDLINHYQCNNLRFDFFELTGWGKNLYIYVNSQNISLSSSSLSLSLSSNYNDDLDINKIDSSNKIVLGHFHEKNLHVITIYSKFIPDIKCTEENLSDMKNIYKALFMNDFSGRNSV